MSLANSLNNRFDRLRGRVKPGMTLGVIILTALIAFELFNYSTTDYALQDLLGPLAFASIRWSTILAIAFCGIDFAGIARLFTSDRDAFEPKQTWYLFGAWLLAATMNALLTWWGVAMAIASHSVKSTAVIDADTLTRIVPIFVAVMVWVIRILIIGSISVNGRRLFGMEQRSARSSYRPQPTVNPGVTSGATLRPLSNSSLSHRPNLVRPTISPSISTARPEPSYHASSLRAEPTYQPINLRQPAPKPALREETQSESLKF
jgi:hypothetical protein